MQTSTAPDIWPAVSGPLAVQGTHFFRLGPRRSREFRWRSYRLEA